MLRAGLDLTAAVPLMTVPPQAGCYKLQIFSFPFFSLFLPILQNSLPFQKKIAQLFPPGNYPIVSFLVITAQYCAYFYS